MLATIGDDGVAKKKTKGKAAPTRDECAWRQAKDARAVDLIDTRDGHTLASLEPSKGDCAGLYNVTRWDTCWRSPKPLSLARAKKLALTLLTIPERAQTLAPRGDKVTSTIAHMLRSDQLNERQAKAAESFRVAYHTIGGVGGACDLERARGRGTLDGPQAQDAMLAAGKLLREAKAELKHDHMVVELVAGAGYSLGESARILYETPTATQKRRLGESLRDGLSTLADLVDKIDGKESVSGGSECEARMQAWRAEFFGDVPVPDLANVVGSVMLTKSSWIIEQAPTTHSTGSKTYHKNGQ